MDHLTILKNFLDEENRLKAFPSKRKLQLCAVSYLAEKFEPGRIYNSLSDTRVEEAAVRRRAWSTRREERDCRKRAQ